MRASVTLLIVALLLRPHGVDATELSDGEGLVRIAGCSDCHSLNERQRFAGGYRLPTPFGTFFTPNITPDKETGIGNWSESDFVKAMRLGVSPAGKYYYPVFPYRSF